MDGSDARDLVPLPREALLGHLRPAARYRVIRLGTERRGELELRRYLVSGATYHGGEVAVSLRLCVADAAAPEVVMSIPGGGGSFPDDALWWLAGRFRTNQAAVDWIGRGQSPAHDAIACRYDPIFMETADFRESFFFHNLSAVWAALNWLFHIGFRPVDLVGGSWGGVHCFLLAALDRRVERVFPTFGCGGFCLPGVEKRSMWDAAFEAMGPERVAQWCAAFDPLLRMGEIGAAVYYETATNDKFFSLAMAMETWRRVANPIFLAILPNRDHDMKPFGVQPYVVQRLAPEPAARCRAITELALRWSPDRGEVLCEGLAPVASRAISLIASEQLAAHGDMSREWIACEPAVREADAARFAVRQTHPEAVVLYFATGTVAVEGGPTLHAATPVRRAIWPPDDRHTIPARRYDMLVDARASDPLSAPIGDKCHPAVRQAPIGWSIEFTGVPRSRATRFGIRPWQLPAAWQAIEVTLAAPPAGAAEALDLVLSRRYQRFDEEAVFQPFRDAAASDSGDLRMFVFRRSGFAPGVIVEERFRPHPPAPLAEVLDDFDAIGLLDFHGRLTEPVVLVAMAIR